MRFAQALGYSGYPEMQRIVRRAQRPGLPPRPGDRQLGLPFSAEGLDAALAAERLALDDAAERLTTPGLGSIVAALAPRTPPDHRGGGARPHGRHAHRGAPRARRPARRGRHRPRPGGPRLARGPRAGGGVLAIAIGRESRVAQAAVSAARAAGVPAAVLVDSSLNPLARSPLSRVVPADARDGSPTLVAMVAVAQALAQALAPVQTRADLAAVGA